jgi:predicted flap endonuclease-1-like 5' DNA nuclease
MHILFNVTYAAHASGTHHKLALDALRHLTGGDAEAWRRLFLKHASLYLDGAKAPDTEFKDFKNHVLHVGDDYWGGAPEKAASWYGMLIEALGGRRWAEAVYAAGILSHYYSDPIHPFHTGQTEAENNIHRAVEWSISRAYDSLAAEGAALDVAGPVASDGPRWLEDLVCQGAETSHRHYERLIAHYDIHRGVSDPPAGLDPIARRLVAELLVYAQKGFALVLSRAFAQAAVAPPEVTLTLETVLATVKIPVKRLLNRLAEGAERRQVLAMYDELRTTGRVEATLAEDDRAVRDLHAREVLAPQAAAREALRARRVAGEAPRQPGPARRPRAFAAPPAPATAARRASVTTESGAAPELTVAARLRDVRIGAAAGADPPPVPAAPRETGDGHSLRRAIDGLRVVEAPPAPAPVESPPPAASEPPPVAVAAAPLADTAPPAEPAAVAPAAAEPLAKAPLRAVRAPRAPRPSQASETSEAPRFHLSAADDLEAAPSIGPKSAERFAALGIVTVGDFLLADPAETAARLKARGVSPDTIVAWQDQARLVMTVPGLRGTHAQLLVGAGYRSAAALAEAEAATLSADILRFAQTSEGQRVLRAGDPPDIAKIMSWIALAASAEAA